MKVIGRSDYIRQYGGVGAFMGAAVGAGVGTFGFLGLSFFGGILLFAVIGGLVGSGYGYIMGRDDTDF